MARSMIASSSSQTIHMPIRAMQPRFERAR
jgi:hypothetical protein